MSNRGSADVIERIGLGAGQWKALFSGGGVWLADGAELLLITSITKVVSKEWDMDAWQRGMIVSIVFFGCLIGNLASGVVGDRLGRRFPVLVSYFGICLFSLLSLLAKSFTTLAFTRFFVGASFGLAQPAFNAFIGEITPSGKRMHLNCMAQVLFCVGELYSGFLIWWQDPFMEDLNWRWLVALGAIPSFVFGLLALVMLKESPAYLMVNGRHDEARQVLQDLRDANGAFDVDVSVGPEQPQEGGGGASLQRRPSLTMQQKYGIVLGRHMLYSTVVVCISVFTLNFLFYGGLYAFPQVLPKLNLHVSPSVDLMMGALVEFPGFALALFLGTYFPRKTCMMVYLLVVLVAVLLFNFASIRIRAGQATPGYQLEPWLEILLQCSLVGHKAFTSVGFLVVYVYSVEIYPTVARTTGGSLCLAAGRIGAMAAPTVFESLLIATSSHAGFFTATAALCAINALLVLFLPFETKDIILPDYMEEQQPIVLANSKIV